MEQGDIIHVSFICLWRRCPLSHLCGQGVSFLRWVGRRLVKPIFIWRSLGQWQEMVAAAEDSALYFLACLLCSAAYVLLASHILALLWTAALPPHLSCASDSQESGARGMLTQSIERSTPCEEVPGSISAVDARSLLVGSGSV